MSAISFPFELQPWMEFFSKNALRKGFELSENGAVSMVSIAPDCRRIVGSAPGSNALPLDVEVDLKRDKSGKLWIDGFCDCETEFNCKHVVAVLFAARRQNPNLLAAPNAASNGMAGAPGTKAVMPAEWQHWLEKLERAAKPVSDNDYPASQPYRLVYVLDLDQSHPGSRVTVRCQKARLLKAGGYGRPNAYSFELATSPTAHKAVQPVDVRIARRILSDREPGHCWHGSREDAGLEGENGAEILELLLTTGRCHWKTLGAAPLRKGEPRKAKPIWRSQANGLQQPALELETHFTAAFLCHGPWYFDQTTGVIGPLDAGLPPRLVAAWVEAPSLPARVAGDLNQVLEARLPDIPLPKAKALAIEQGASIEPKPCLRLSTARFHWWEVSWDFRKAGVEGAPVHLARMGFDYDGVRIDETYYEDVVERMDGDKVIRTPRAHASERKFIEMLCALGLQPAEESLHCPVDKRTQDAWALRNNTEDAWFKFCLDQLPKLRNAGWIIEYADDFHLRLAEPTDWYADVAEENGNDWFGVELGVQVGDEKINLLPVLMNLLKTRPEDFTPQKLAKIPNKRLVRVPLGDGRILPFPGARLRAILSTLIELHDPKALNKKGHLELPRLRAAELAGMVTNDEWRWFGSDQLKELGRRLKNFDGIRKVKLPAGLQAELRPYQHDGLNWLQFLREYNLAGVLADDMGLGKTVQALAHLLVEKQAGRLDRPSLVIAPTTLMTNWRQESERFAPDLRVLVSHGGDRKQHFEKLRDFDLVLTSYSLLPRDQEVLLATEFHLVILDEAQYIKNPKTKWAQIACLLKARHQLCLTGTPMENHLGELWSLFNFLLPGFLGDEVRFRALFRNPIEKAGNQDRREVLARRIAPFVLRRRKEQVLKELPPKVEIVQNVELNGEQRDLYETIRLAMHAKVKAEIENKGVSRSHIIILDALLKLRQVCCDPRLVPLDAARCVKESAKLELLMDLLPEMLEEGRRILLFSQFTSMLALIEQELAKKKINWVKLTGETQDRATPVNQFQSGKAPLFLISLKAGGTGLNLTAADTVIHYDPWWNPAVENQATDRAHRIGQDKKVFVYKLMTVGTVEEKIVAMQSRKRELLEGLLDDRKREKLQLSVEDLDVLFAPLQ